MFCDRAIALYVLAGERSRTAHPLITLGLLYHDRLATVYVRENRHRDLIQVAEEMIQIFTSQKVGRDLLAACLLFQEAARGGQVTMEMIERLVVSLKSFRSGVK